MNTIGRRRIGQFAAALLISLALCRSACAATYYVDAVSGIDTNNGTASTTPWKTIAKVNAKALLAGDTVLLKRGCVWREQLYITKSGTSSAPITFDAYGTGANPIINGSNSVTSWTGLGSNKYSATVSQESSLILGAVNPSLVLFNGVKGTQVASAGAVTAANTWYWANNTLTVYGTSTPTGVEVGARMMSILINAQQYITIKNIEVIYSDEPILLINAKNITLQNLTVRDSIGHGGIYILGQNGGAAQSNTISACTVYNITGSLWSLSDGNKGNGIFLYQNESSGSEGTVSSNTISGNTVHDNGEEGIVIFGGSNNTVSLNTVYNHAQSGIRIGDGTSATTTTNASGNVIERNVSYGNGRSSDDRYGIDLIRVGNNNTVRYNIVHDQYDTLHDSSVPADPTNGGVKYGTGGIRFDGGNWSGYDHMSSTQNKIYGNIVYNEHTGIDIFNFDNVSVYNNVVYNSGSVAIGVVSYDSSRPVANTVVKNNIFYSPGSFFIVLQDASGSAVDYNCYYPESANTFSWINKGVSKYSNFTVWKTNSGGMDTHSLTSDPDLVNEASYDFHLSSGSPCRDKGTSTILSKDFDNNVVPTGAAPDIGAYELAATEYSISIAVSPAGAGSVTLNPTGGSYLAGTAVTLTAAPNSGYSFANWTGDATGTTNPLTVTVNGNKTITANYTQGACTITASAGSNGTISPSGAVAVSPGQSQTFTITPNSGYGIASLLVDGVAVSKTSPYTFSAVSANHTIAATFASKPALPTSLAATAASMTSTKLTWTYNSTTPVTGFTIMRSTSSTFPAGSTTVTLSAGAAARSFTDTGLVYNTQYYYKICAVNDAGSSSYTGSKSTKPILIAPTNLAVTVSAGVITCSWTNNSPDSTRFSMQRSTSSSFTNATSWYPTASPYKISGAAAGTYYYKVRAQAVVGTTTRSSSWCTLSVPVTN